MPGIRREDDTLQQKAVREAFANAIIHSDVLLSGGVLRIDKYDDRLCLRNPGTLKLPVYQIYEGGTSRARNPRIQNMLRMIGYGENLGSGFPMILNAWKESGWCEPELNNKTDIDEVELVLPFKVAKDNNANNSGTKSDVPENVSKNVLKDVSKNVLKDLPSEIVSKLSERQIVIIGLIKETPNIAWREISEKLDVSIKTVQRDFADMRNLGVVINREGGKTFGHWTIQL